MTAGAASGVMGRGNAETQKPGCAGLCSKRWEAAQLFVVKLQVLATAVPPDFRVAVKVAV